MFGVEEAGMDFGIPGGRGGLPAEFLYTHPFWKDTLQLSIEIGAAEVLAQLWQSLTYGVPTLYAKQRSLHGDSPLLNLIAEELQKGKTDSIRMIGNPKNISIEDCNSSICIGSHILYASSFILSSVTRYAMKRMTYPDVPAVAMSLAANLQKENTALKLLYVDFTQFVNIELEEDDDYSKEVTANSFTWISAKNYALSEAKQTISQLTKVLEATNNKVVSSMESGRLG